ncbi:uncharacterized protein METZ01_LOCUS103994, partial [marine metagenome]
VTEDKKPELPSRMRRVHFPNAKFGLYAAIFIICLCLFLIYKDSIF